MNASSLTVSGLSPSTGFTVSVTPIQGDDFGATGERQCVGNRFEITDVAPLPSVLSIKAADGRVANVSIQPKAGQLLEVPITLR